MSAVVIIDSGGANLASLQFAFERLGVQARVSRDPREVGAAERVVLPGVGSARDAMQRLATAGLDRCIRSLRQPVLGICLGMQLLFEHSEEGDTPCLGVLPGTVRRLVPERGLPVPHMGWNALAVQRPDPLLADLGAAPYVYFVHSFAALLAAPSIPELTLASARYGADIAAVVRSGNFWGAQFHPERSAASGARLLANFLSLAG